MDAGDNGRDAAVSAAGVVFVGESKSFVGIFGIAISPTKWEGSQPAGR